MNHLDPAHDLRSLMERSLTEVRPDTDRIGAAARSRGRTVRRRRTGAVVGAMAAVALAVVVVLPVLGDGDSTSGPGFATDPPSPSPSPEVRTGTADATFPNSLSLVDVPARQLLRRLRPLLPDDADITRAELALTDTAPGESTERSGSLLVDLDRRGGGGLRGSLELTVYAAPTPPLAKDDPTRLGGIACPPVGYSITPTSCTVLMNTDGVVAGRALAYTDSGFVIREVLVEATTGDWVRASDANSLDDKWGAGYTYLNGEPPLSIAELRTVAESPTWTNGSPPPE